MITSEQYRQIQECTNDGLTMAETGRRLHLPASVVRNWWRKSEEELLLFYKAIMKLSNERSLILISNRDLPLWNEMKADRHVIETLSARLSHNSQMIYL